MQLLGLWGPIHEGYIEVSFQMKCFHSIGQDHKSKGTGFQVVPLVDKFHSMAHTCPDHGTFGLEIGRTA